MSTRPDDASALICLIAGGELRVMQAGERINVAVHMRNARVPLTASLDTEQAERFFSHGQALVPAAKEYRRLRRGKV
jgi:hypothetical protein